MTSKICLIVALFCITFAHAHMWLRTPLSIGGANSIGGTTPTCDGLVPGQGSTTTYEQGQNVTFQFRVNQHGSDPFSFKLSTDGGKTFGRTLAQNIQNQVVAGPDGFQGVNVPVSIPTDITCQNCVVQLSGMGTNGAGTWYNCANVQIVLPGSLGIPFPHTVQPSQGSTAGGTTVIVSGTQFGNASSTTLACKFDFNIVPATWISSTQVSCVTPPKNSPADAILEVTLDGTHYSNTGTIYSYFGGVIQPVVDNISPMVGGPGTNVTITGEYFYSPTMQCKFNSTVVTANVLSSTVAYCVVPTTFTGNGYVPVEVNVDGSIYSQSGLQFDVGGNASSMPISVSRAFGLAIILILGALFA